MYIRRCDQNVLFGLMATVENLSLRTYLKFSKRGSTISVSLSSSLMSACVYVWTRKYAKRNYTTDKKRFFSCVRCVCITWRSQINISLGKSNSFCMVFIHHQTDFLELWPEKRHNFKSIPIWKFIYVVVCAYMRVTSCSLAHIFNTWEQFYICCTHHVVRGSLCSYSLPTSNLCISVRTGAGTINSHTNGLKSIGSW